MDNNIKEFQDALKELKHQMKLYKQMIEAHTKYDQTNASDAVDAIIEQTFEGDEEGTTQVYMNIEEFKLLMRLIRTCVTDKRNLAATKEDAKGANEK